MPISTPLMAGIDITACASRPSSRRSHCACDPRPKGTPEARTSISPPSVSPRSRHCSTSRFSIRVLVGVERVERASIAQEPLLLDRLIRDRRRGRHGDWPDRDDVSENGDAQRREQLLGQRAGGHPGGGFAGTGPLQHAADRTEVLQRAAQVAVARPRASDLVQRVERAILVGNQQGDGAADRGAAPETAEDLDPIRLDLLPRTAAEPSLPAAQFLVDR